MQYTIANGTLVMKHVISHLIRSQVRVLSSLHGKGTIVLNNKLGGPPQSTTNYILRTESTTGGDKAKTKKQKPKKDLKPYDVSRLDFRVAKIIKIENHPNADSLYSGELDIGDGNPRKFCSALVNIIKLADLKGKDVVALCNIKPVSMRGIDSQAMIMCAHISDKVELLVPPENCNPGQKIIFKNHERDLDDEIKKSKLDKIFPDLKTNKDCVALYKEDPFTVKGKVVKVPTLANASIK